MTMSTHKSQWTDKYESPQKRSFIKESYAVCLMVTLWYYYFSVLKALVGTQCKIILSTAATCACKLSKKNPCFVH